jgi:hypothetical protein
MKVIYSVQEAVRQVTTFEGDPEDFQLAISEQLLDPVGVSMAIITDYVLKRDWEPDGFSQGDGFRTYRYKRWSSGDDLRDS